MAACLHFLLLLLCSFVYTITVSQAKPSYPENALIFHVTKDASTLQYLTKIHHGTPLSPTKFVVDLGGPFLWLNCASASGSSLSTSSHLISRGSIKCLAAKPTTQDHGSNKSNCLSSNDNNKCAAFPENRITQIATQGDLVEDFIAVQITDGSKTGSITTLHYQFLFSCAPKLLLNGLASGAKGMFGLGRTKTSMASQIASEFSSKWQFTLCLSSSNGVILHDNGHYGSYFGSQISDSLTYTPLITNQFDSPHEYFINLKSIKINGKRLSLNKQGQEGHGGIKLSTIVPYTTLESSIYATFTKAYDQAAISMNMTRVAPVAPFGLCFSSENLDVTRVGPKVPVIDLGLQSEMVKWRIHGRNSMVQVSKEVMCLGFLDGGMDMKTWIVLGGYQLEDTLFHFDLGASMLGFSPSLLMNQKTCSDLRLGSTLKDSL